MQSPHRGATLSLTKVHSLSVAECVAISKSEAGPPRWTFKSAADFRPPEKCASGFTCGLKTPQRTEVYGGACGSTEVREKILLIRVRRF